MTVVSAPRCVGLVCALIPLKTVSSYVVCTRTYVYKVISVNKRLRQFFLRHRHRERLTRDSWLPRAWDDNSVRPLVLGARPPCSALSTNSGYKIGPEPSLIATVRGCCTTVGRCWLAACGTTFVMQEASKGHCQLLCPVPRFVEVRSSGPITEAFGFTRRRGCRA